MFNEINKIIGSGSNNEIFCQNGGWAIITVGKITRKLCISSWGPITNYKLYIIFAIQNMYLLIIF